ncbi:hypothetical protein HAX54_048026 [Datura stramonium]|uniref:Pectinesterase n=1 Tax=Datura stramonium TaxID=4076 RepID=A0ABS8WL01_DATST|nr:hypothetical protein [Datura stramonium]
MVSESKVYHRKARSSLKLVKQIINLGERMLVLYGGLVQLRYTTEIGPVATNFTVYGCCNKHPIETTGRYYNFGCYDTIMSGTAIATARCNHWVRVSIAMVSTTDYHAKRVIYGNTF